MEIRNVYSYIRYLQAQATESSKDWIELYLRENLFSFSIYDDQTELSDKQKKIISELLERKFSRSGWDGSCAGTREITICLLHNSRRNSYQQLKYLKTFDILPNTLSFLIQEYEWLNDFSDMTPMVKDNIVNYLTNPKIILRHNSIELIWEEIIKCLRVSLLYSNQKNGEYSTINTPLLAQIDALVELTCSLNHVISRRNSKCLSFAPETEKEKIIMGLKDDEFIYGS